MLPGDENSNDQSDAGDKTAVLSTDQETLKREIQKAKEMEACLIIVRGSPQGHRFFLTQSQMLIGRDPSSEITINDQSVSKKHAMVLKEKTRVLLTDVGSANGTFVNDKKIAKDQPIELHKEDMIKLGNTILKYLPAGEIEILFYGNLGSAAHTDALTKIYNKRYLTEALEAEFKRAKALHTDFSIIFFDIDHFKKINDTHGHDAGDYVLREVANVIRTQYVRQKDIFARYGGEEFVILLAATAAAPAAEIAERIRASLESHQFIYEGKRIPVTSSFGVAELRTGIESSQTLLKEADKALYSAKQSGRNSVIVAR